MVMKFLSDMREKHNGPHEVKTLGANELWCQYPKKLPQKQQAELPHFILIRWYFEMLKYNQ